MSRNEIFYQLYFILDDSQAARKAAGLHDSDDEGGDIFTEGHDEDLLF